MENSKTYTLQSRYKAAFLNKLEKVNIETNSHDIQDDELDSTFTITINGPENINMVDRILKAKTAIDTERPHKHSINNKKVEDRLRDIIKEQIQITLGKR